MALFPMVPTLGSLSCRAILEKQVVHIRDVQADPDYLRSSGPLTQIFGRI